MVYRRRLKYYLLKLCRLHDSPRAVAGGFAWGMVTHFYPTFGFGPLFAVGLAKIFRTNLVAATLAWAITMPLFPLFFYFNVITGDLFVERDVRMAIYKISRIKLKGVLILGKAFIIGSIVNGLLAAVTVWWVGTIILKCYRKEIITCIRRSL